MHTPTMKEGSQKGFLYYSRSKLGVQQNACGMNTWEKVPKKKKFGGGGGAGGMVSLFFKN